MTRRERDEGRVLLLVIGTVVVVLALVAVVVDAGRLYLARRALDAATDAAALAGAQAADLDAVYAGRTGDAVPIDSERARRAVARHLDAVRDAEAIDALRLDRVVVDAESVTVTTSVRVRLPFVGPFAGGRARVEVSSSATAHNRLR